MFNFFIKIISYTFFYDLIKRIKNSFLNKKIFYIVDIKSNKKINFRNKIYYNFTKKNLEKFLFNKNTYFYITHKNITYEKRLKKYYKLLKLFKSKKIDLVYDGNCEYYSEICSSKLLLNYYKFYKIDKYPYYFFYFNKKFKLNIRNIGTHHRIYNFNGSFLLPTGGKTIGDSGDISFRLNFIPNLLGKTFLDIGTEEGYSVFDSLFKKKSKFSKGINIYEDKEYDFFPQHLRPATFTKRKREDLAKTRLFLKKLYKLENSKKVSFDYQNIYNLGTTKFDYVFCFGVLYHLKNPYLAIENLFNVTKKVLLIETQGSFNPLKNQKEGHYSIIGTDDGFVRHSPEALKFLLLKVGFRKVKIIFSGVNRKKKISNIVLKALK